MTVDRATILAEISDMIRAVLGDAGTDAEIDMETSFRDDLEMESIDIVSLAGRLQARYGGTVNFAQFVATLDVEAAQRLRVGQLVEHIAAASGQADAVPAPVGAAFAEPERIEAAAP